MKKMFVIIKKFIKNLLKVFVFLIILCGVIFAGYSTWIFLQLDKKLTFFKENQPEQFSKIEWTTNRTFWESLTYDITEFGDIQEGYDAEGRLVYKHVLMNEEVPVVAYYFGGGENYDILSVHWIVDCEPNKIFIEVEKETGTSNLSCWKDGKSVVTGRMINQEYMPKVVMGGFSYWPINWQLDMRKLRRNKLMKGSIF
jgi:hypothetical protein